MNTSTENAARAKRSDALGVALVTGGRRGIGRAVCRDLAERGFDIAFLDLDEDDDAQKTQAMVRDAGRRVRFIAADIACTRSIAAVVEHVAKELGPITCLVNNAGVQVAVRGDPLDTDEAEFDRLIGTNLRGTYFVTQLVARHMLAAAAEEHPRSIITVTSANAALVSPEKGAYCISKAGLSMAMQVFALRLAEAGIRVHEIRPGLIETAMTKDVLQQYSPRIEDGSICALRRWGQPDDVARAIGALATGAIPFSTGDVYHIGGGMQISRL
jgi:NAD(P)-dependent dehydrogenase (short-subunit alcohol dehydrogenase family)